MNESAANSFKVLIDSPTGNTNSQYKSVARSAVFAQWQTEKVSGVLESRWGLILFSYHPYLILFASAGQNNSTTCPALVPYTDQHAALLARVDWDLLTWAKLSVSEPPCGQRFSLNANESGETRQVLAADKSAAYCLRSATCRPDLLALAGHVTHH